VLTYTKVLTLSSLIHHKDL